MVIRNKQYPHDLKRVLVREIPNPECDKCGEPYRFERKELGYNTCLACGELLAQEVKFCIAPVHKSNYIVVSRKRDLIGINNKTSNH